MNIFEENRRKYQIKSKKDAAILGVSTIAAGGVLFLIGLPLSFFIIGIPLVIAAFVIMAIGGIMILVSPFVKIKPQE